MMLDFDTKITKGTKVTKIISSRFARYTNAR